MRSSCSSSSTPRECLGGHSLFFSLSDNKSQYFSSGMCTQKRESKTIGQRNLQVKSLFSVPADPRTSQSVSRFHRPPETLDPSKSSLKSLDFAPSDIVKSGRLSIVWIKTWPPRSASRESLFPMRFRVCASVKEMRGTPTTKPGSKTLKVESSCELKSSPRVRRRERRGSFSPTIPLLGQAVEDAFHNFPPSHQRSVPEGTLANRNRVGSRGHQHRQTLRP